MDSGVSTEQDRKSRSVSSDVYEIGRQLVGGAVTRAPEMVGSALEWWAPEGSEAERLGKIAKDYWKEKGKGWEPDLKNRGIIASTLIEGAAQAAPSMMGMAATLVNPVVGGAFVATLFGGQQAQETFDKGIAAGLKPEEATKAAYLTGLIEGFGETVADVAGAKLLTGAGKAVWGVAKGGVEGAAKAATSPEWAMRFAKDWTANAVIQSATEYGQGYGEAAVEKAYGIDKQDPHEAGVQGARVALGMSALLGGPTALSHRSMAKDRAKIGELLNDQTAPTDLRIGAAKFVENDIKGDVGEEKASQWMAQMEKAITSPSAEQPAKNQPVRQDAAVNDGWEPIDNLPDVGLDASIPISTQGRPAGQTVTTDNVQRTLPPPKMVGTPEGNVGTEAQVEPNLLVPASNSAPDKRLSYRGSIDAENLTNAVKSKPFIEQGFRGLDVETQGSVLESMIRAAENDKILNSIVSSIPIDVMNVLVSQQLTPKMLFHNKTMLLDFLSSGRIGSAKVHESTIGATVRAVASATAKDILALRDVGQISVDDNTTGGTGRGASVSGENGTTNNRAEISRRKDLARQSIDTGTTVDTINDRHNVTPNSDVGLGAEGAQTPSVPTILPRTAAEEKLALKERSRQSGAQQAAPVARPAAQPVTTPQPAAVTPPAPVAPAQAAQPHAKVEAAAGTLTAAQRGQTVKVKATNRRGQTVTIDENAGAAIDRIGSQLDLARSLLECLAH